MGYNLVVTTERDLGATERDPEVGAVLSRGFTYALLRDDGDLAGVLDPALLRRLQPDWNEDEDAWQERDPAALRADLDAVWVAVQDRNGDLPVQHRLESRGVHGTPDLLLPAGTFDWAEPPARMTRLDGDHGDPAHRDDLRAVDVRVHPDAVAWGRRRRARPRWLRRPIRIGRFTWARRRMLAPPPGEPPRLWFVEGATTWLPAAATVEVLGERVEVDSWDAVRRYGPDVAEARAVCERAERAGRPVFWITW